jgi:hypothetical protein
MGHVERLGLSKANAISAAAKQAIALNIIAA